MTVWYYGPFAQAAGEEVTWTLSFAGLGPTTPFIQPDLLGPRKSRVTVSSLEVAQAPADEWAYKQADLRIMNHGSDIAEFMLVGIRL